MGDLLQHVWSDGKSFGAEVEPPDSSESVQVVQFTAVNHQRDRRQREELLVPAGELLLRHASHHCCNVPE